ncbi:MAG: DNA primase [Flavobacteriales bacterium]|nr:DNA primase [Flavobacteriales bacterium]
MISKDTIDKVYDAARVEEVISDYVQLKKSGSNLKGLSPFSDERTPSFMVSPVKQIWKDFSSGKGGNAIAFLMEYEHFTYPEAIRHLAKKYHIEIEETTPSDQDKAATDERESLYLVSEFANKYFQDVLFNTEEGKAIGLTYFKERGFTQETIKKFGLGYSPDQWEAFTKEALGKGYQLDFLEKTGLTIVKEQKQFDRFKGRVMFPIVSVSGRVLGFGGRILNADKKAAKYLNSPESPVYHKSKILYGLYQAKQAIAKNDNCYLVEGYTDVIQFNQSGVENVVSSSGTALTPDQIRLISRLTKNVTVLFDGDAAGLRASLRGIDLILEEGMNVKVCAFPDGEDPDSFARSRSQDELETYLHDNAKDFIQFKASLLVDDAANDPIKKADTIRDMVVSIAKIPDRIQREVYIQECAKIMAISEEVLFNTLAQQLNKGRAKEARENAVELPVMQVVKEEQAPVARVDSLLIIERKIIELLLLYGNREEEFEDVMMKANEEGELVMFSEWNTFKVYDRIFMDLQDDEIEFSNPNFRKVYQSLMTYYQQNDEFKTDAFLSQLPQELHQEVVDILMLDDRDSLHKWEEQKIVVKQKTESVAQNVTETILTLRWYLVDKLVKSLITKVSNEPDADNAQILQDVKDYSTLIRRFSEQLGRVLSRF